jgi:hypothetical protein
VFVGAVPTNLIRGGGLVEASQVWPLSMLNSVNTSKKLLMVKPPLDAGEMAVLPVEARVGLSRMRMPAGRPPPEISNCSISVS